MQKISFTLALLGVVLLSACQSPTPSVDLYNQSTSENQAAWVSKDLGLKQCEQASGQDALNRTQQILHQSNLSVLTAHCANDDIMRVQVCGAPQGTLGIYKIKQAHLTKAQSLGFKQVQATQYQQSPCS